MALKIGDRVKQRTNSTGTAGISLIGSFDGFQTFSSVLASGDTTYYVIEEADKFEVGLGTFTSGSLERTVVFASSNSGSKISLGGSGIVSITYPAERAVYVNRDLHSVISSGLLFSNNDQLVSTSGSLFYNSTNLLTGSQAYSSGIATYASGQAIENEADIVTASGALRAGITSNTTLVTYASGQAIANEADIATNVSNISYVSGNAAYASGQSITNESDIVASSGIANYASGQAISNQSNIVASSGIANYASGQAITNKSNIATNTSNIATNSAGITYVSGIAVYASGQAIENESDILSLIGASGTATALIASSGIASYASGQAIENETGIVYNSGIATYSSGVASSQASNVTYVSGIAVDASGAAYYASGLLSGGSASGVPFYSGDGVLETSTNLVYNTAADKFGIGITPAEKLDVKGTIRASGNGYKLEGQSIAKLDGSKLQLGDWNSENYPVSIYAGSNERIVMKADGNVGINHSTPTAQLDVYNDNSTEMAMRIIAAPGQSTNLQEFQSPAGNLIAAVTSVGIVEVNEGFRVMSNGIGTTNYSNLGLTYNGTVYVIASETTGTGQSHKDIHIKRNDGLLKVTPSGIVANPSLSTSGVLSSGVLLYDHVPASTTNRLYNDGGVLKFNGAAVDSASNTYVSGIAVYASGLAGTNETDIVTASGALRTDITSNTNIATYASGQVLSLQVASGLANYASGNTSNISFGSNATGDLLYHNGSKFIRLPIGSSTNVLKVIGGVPAWSSEAENIDTYTSGNATYASGQAIANEADIVTASGALRTDVTSSTNIATYASGLLSGGTASGISFYGAAQVLNSDSTLVYNSGLGYLGIGTVPTHSLDVAGPINASGTGYKVSGRSIATYDQANTKLKLGDWNDESFAVSLYADGDEIVVLKSNGNVGIANTNPLAQLDVTNDTSSDMAMRITAAAGQSANLQEWQNSAGTMLAALTSVGVIENSNGVKVYASGIGTGNVSRITTKYDSSNYYIQTETTGTGQHSDIQIKRNTTSVHVGEDHVLVTPSLSSSGLMASGLLLHSHVPVSTTNALYNEGGTLKFNGSAIGGGGGGDVTTAQLQYVSGIAVYSSGQAIENEGGILALQSASGIATSLLVASGSATYASGQAIANETDIVTASGALRTDVTSNTNIATYASGQVLSLGVASGLANYASGNTSNISFGSNAEGDILYHNGSKFIRLAKGTDDYILKMNGNVPNWEAESGGGGDVTTAQLQYVSGIAVYSSGQAIANESDILALQSASGIATSLLAVSGTATSLVASSGIATYSSGQAISNQTNIATNVTNITYVSGVAASLVASSGIATYASGQAIANETDIVTASGALRTDITSNTNIATYGSGQALSLQVASGLANYASGQAVENETDIVTASGALRTDITSNTNIATYGSGQVLSLQVASGAANYASGNTANISFGSNAEGDILYNNGTKFIRLAKGTDNHVLTMDGNVPNWEAAAGGGSPGGSDTQIQFNDSSSFGGDGDLTWNKTTNVLTINGTLMAGIKSFVIDHPTKEDMKLQYSCLEGPENGVYVRGAVEGNVIDLPDYWVGLVDESSITVQLTANGYSQPGLFVDRIQDNKVYLISEQRINAYYIVHATRKDVEPLEVEWLK